MCATPAVPTRAGGPGLAVRQRSPGGRAPPLERAERGASRSNQIFMARAPRQTTRAIPLCRWHPSSSARRGVARLSGRGWRARFWPLFETGGTAKAKGAVPHRAQWPCESLHAATTSEGVSPFLLLVLPRGPAFCAGTARHETHGKASSSTRVRGHSFERATVPPCCTSGQPVMRL